MSKPKITSVRKLLESRKDLMLPAFLGDRSGTVKADVNNNVYVTLFNGEVFTVQNNRVPNVPRLPVVIGYEAGNKTLLQVLRTRDVFESANYPDIPEHAKANHEWPGVDTLWVRGEQFIPGLAVPVTGLTVQIFGFVYYLTAWQVLPTQEIDMTASLPTTGALFVLVEVDDAGVISLRDGTPIASREVLTYADIPLPAADKKPLFAVKMYAGQTGIIKSRLDTDIIDLRFAGFGTGGGGGSFDLAAAIHAATEDTSPSNDDEFGIWESVSGLLRKIKWSSIVTGLGAYFVSHSSSTASNDFLVGSGTGAWIKKTLAQTITILRTSLDSVYAALSHTHAASDITSGTLSDARLPAPTTTTLGGVKRNTGSAGEYVTGIDSAGALTYDTPAGGGGREILSANRTYYVRTDGSNSNDGLANTAGGAFLTIQKALDVVATLDLSIYNVTIQVADGTYTGANTVNGVFVGKGTVTVKGNTTTPANVIISTTSANCFTVSGKATIYLEAFKMQTTTSGYCLSTEGQSTIYGSNLNFGACANFHMICFGASIIQMLTSYTISGGAQRHWHAGVGGIIIAFSITITLTGTPNFTQQFATATVLGVLSVYTNTFSGSATGKRYDATANGAIYTNGGGATYLPGNAAGTTATGGQYV